MGFISDLFEPTGGGTERESVLRRGQEGLLDALTNLLSGQIGQGVTPFQGIRPGEVPFGPLQQQAFGLAGGLGQGIGAGIDVFGQSLGGFDPSQGQGLLGQGVGALQGATQQFDPQSILSALEPGRQLAERQFEQRTVPSLLERFGATSGASGPLNRALAEAGVDLSLGLGAQAAGPLIQGQQAQLNRQLQGAGQFGQFAGIPGQLAGQGLGIGGGATDLLSRLFGFGGLQQGLGQGIAGAEQARFQEAQAFANPFLNLLGPALGTQGFQAFQQPSGPSPLSQIGGFFGGAGAFGTQGAFGPFI